MYYLEGCLLTLATRAMYTSKENTKRQEITTKINHMEYAHHHHHQLQLALAVVTHALMAHNSIARTCISTCNNSGDRLNAKPTVCSGYSTLCCIY
jgi:hypothetical protein